MKKIVSQLEKQFEAFFSRPAPAKTSPTDFEVSKDLHLLDEIGRNLPDETVDRAILLFSKLMIFFERGILLEKLEAQKYTPQLVFQTGQLMAVDGPGERLYCDIPSVRPEQVLKLKNMQLLENLKLEVMNNDPRLTALLFQPIPEFAFILFSPMPDLWLKDHAKNTLTHLMKNLNP